MHILGAAEPRACGGLRRVLASKPVALPLWNCDNHSRNIGKKNNVRQTCYLLGATMLANEILFHISWVGVNGFIIEYHWRWQNNRLAATSLNVHSRARFDTSKRSENQLSFARFAHTGAPGANCDIFYPRCRARRWQNTDRKNWKRLLFIFKVIVIF